MTRITYRSTVWFAATLLATVASARAQPLTTVLVASGLTKPVSIAAPPGDTTRLFVVQQTGQIRIIDLTASPPALLATPFLDIAPLINLNVEQGLLGLAFDPNHATNGYLYIVYNNTAGWIVIGRYSLSADPNVADPTSAVILKTIPHSLGGHNGGCAHFGLDGYLYVSTGDAQNFVNAQSTGVLLGKMLRLDVNNPPTYIPATNPFVGPGNPLDEIWALGLRNPWRFSFDRLTGDLYIADVGYQHQEEMNFAPAASAGGENYGWPCYQGASAFMPAGCLPRSNYQFPIHSYAHTPGGFCGGAVIGGFVYRGSAACWLRGAYFFGDHCKDSIWTFRVADGSANELTQRDAQLAPEGGLSIAKISTFGEDADGELYIADWWDGEIFKIVPGPGLLDIASASPTANYVDPRQDLTSGAPAGLGAFTITLPNSNGGYCPSDITVDCSGGSPCPTVTSVSMTANAVFSVALDGPIPPSYCTRFTFAHTAPGAMNPLTYRFLPGDVNADGTPNTQDLLALVSALSSGTANLMTHDINRDGTPTTQDLLRLVQLLNGTASTRVWHGATLTCP